MVCPICRQPTSWDDNPWRPFCSERCKLIDLGAWASESYRIEQESRDEAEDEDQEGNEEAPGEPLAVSQEEALNADRHAGPEPGGRILGRSRMRWLTAWPVRCPAAAAGTHVHWLHLILVLLCSAQLIRVLPNITRQPALIFSDPVARALTQIKIEPG